MGNCLSCGHEYERHLFGGMCFYCDCKRAQYNTGQLVFLKKRQPGEQHTNGSAPRRNRKRGTSRLGNM